MRKACIAAQTARSWNTQPRNWKPAAVAVSLAEYGVAYGRGFAYGIGLQAIEASVGIGIGTIFLAREGLSYGTLKTMDSGDDGRSKDLAPLEETERAGASLPG